MSDAELHGEINKRLTLNWLIQGVAQHAMMTVHHLVRDELTAIHPKLLRFNDQFALIGLLQYWYLDAILIYGWPPRYWRRAATRPSHPFFGHPLLSRHGGMLAAAARQRAIERSKEKGLILNSLLFPYQALYVMIRITMLEAKHQSELAELAKKTTSMVWKIPVDRLNGTLTNNVIFRKISGMTFLRRLIHRASVSGYGGVMPCGDSLEVMARAKNFCVLVHELVKGTAELICLHGLNTLDDETYKRVVDHADKFEYESWMLQSGGELWRRLLAVAPEGYPLAELLMHLARMLPGSLESLMMAVIEQPELARERLAGLFDTPSDPD